MFLGIDIGTSGVKAVLLDDRGQLYQQAQAPLAVDRPNPLWSEQDPDAWWAATDAAVCRLDAGLRARIAGVGLAGQMHGATVLGDDDRPLRPAILWNDGRSFAECAELEAAVPAPEGTGREQDGEVCGATRERSVRVAEAHRKAAVRAAADG